MKAALPPSRMPTATSPTAIFNSTKVSSSRASWPTPLARPREQPPQPASATASTTISNSPSAPDAMGTVLGDDIAASVAAYEARFGNRTIKIYGNAPFSAASVSFDGYNPATGDEDATYSVNWTSASTNIIVEVAGHIA